MIWGKIVLAQFGLGQVYRCDSLCLSVHVGVGMSYARIGRQFLWLASYEYSSLRSLARIGIWKGEVESEYFDINYISKEGRGNA